MTSSVPLPKFFRLLNERRRARLEAFRSAAKGIASYSFEHVMFLGGLALVAYGAWLFWHPLGFVVGGYEMVKVSFLASEEHTRR